MALNAFLLCNLDSSFSLVSFLIWTELKPSWIIILDKISISTPVFLDKLISEYNGPPCVQLELVLGDELSLLVKDTSVFEPLVPDKAYGIKITLLMTRLSVPRRHRSIRSHPLKISSSFLYLISRYTPSPRAPHHGWAVERSRHAPPSWVVLWHPPPVAAVSNPDLILQDLNRMETEPSLEGREPERDRTCVMEIL